MWELAPKTRLSPTNAWPQQVILAVRIRVSDRHEPYLATFHRILIAVWCVHSRVGPTSCGLMRCCSCEPPACASVSSWTWSLIAYTRYRVKERG